MFHNYNRLDTRDDAIRLVIIIIIAVALLYGIGD